MVVKLLTSEPGLYGLGCATFTQRFHAVVAAIERHLKPFLLGRDVDRIEEIWLVARRRAPMDALAADLTRTRGVPIEADLSGAAGVRAVAEHAVEHALRMKPKDPTRGWSLVMLSVATSIDALVVVITQITGGPGRRMAEDIVAMSRRIREEMVTAGMDRERVALIHHGVQAGIQGLAPYIGSENEIAAKGLLEFAGPDQVLGVLREF